MNRRPRRTSQKALSRDVRYITRQSTWRTTVALTTQLRLPSDISVFRLPRISFHCPKLRWSTPAIFDRYQSRRPTGTTHIARLLFAQRLSWSQGCLWPHRVQAYGVTMTNAVSGEPKIAQAYKAERRKSTSFNVLGRYPWSSFDGRTVIQRRVPGTTRTTFLQIAKTVTNKSLLPISVESFHEINLFEAFEADGE